MPKPTDIRLVSVEAQTNRIAYRTPIKFGGTALDRVTLLNVTCRVRTRTGKSAEGFGSMPLGNVWAFPSRLLSYDALEESFRTFTLRKDPQCPACGEGAGELVLADYDELCMPHHRS